MNSDNVSSLSNGLAYDARLPFCCRPRQSDDLTIAACDEKNQRLLQSLATLDEHHIENQEENRELSGDIARLESKVDLLLEMMSKLLVSSDQLSPTEVCLSADGVSWYGDVSQMQEKGAAIWIELMLDERLLEPLKLPAEVYSCEALHGEMQCVARFVNMGEGVSELLGKIIFRHHRREIAGLREQKKK